MKNFHRAAPELHVSKIGTKFTLQRMTKYCVHIQHATSIAFLDHTELSRYQSFLGIFSFHNQPPVHPRPRSQLLLSVIFNSSWIDTSGSDKVVTMHVCPCLCVCVHERETPESGL